MSLPQIVCNSAKNELFFSEEATVLFFVEEERVPINLPLHLLLMNVKDPFSIEILEEK